MPEPYTIDASVFLNAWDTCEAGRQASYDFLRRAGMVHAALFLPTLVLPEIAASFTRERGDVNGARELVALVEQSPGVRLVALDTDHARDAVSVATRSRLRGSDSVYAAVALRYSTVLVTRDGEMRQRLAGIVTVHTPEEALVLL